MLYRKPTLCMVVPAICGVLIAGCAKTVVLPDSGTDRDVLRRLSRANVQLLKVRKEMLGCEVSLMRPSWGPYYLPSYDTFLFILNEGGSVGGYVVVDRQGLSNSIRYQQSVADYAPEFPCFAGVTLAGDKLELSRALGDVGAYVRPIAQPHSSRTSATVTLRQGQSITTVLLSLACVSDRVLVLPVWACGWDVSLKRPFWGPYYLASRRKHVFVLRDGETAGGYALLDMEEALGMVTRCETGSDCKDRARCYSQISISSGGVVGEGELGLVEMETCEVGSPVPPDFGGLPDK
ncbi:MAG TPA: hypothetical protein VNA25_18805 [Phycisphaerae bacterium]|nr:hypothetical protein [Phycisphaerae bacterium]